MDARTTAGLFLIGVPAIVAPILFAGIVLSLVRGGKR